jgi:molybdopterin-containing oxidoreductase family iron-sulfur binding subunit
MGTVGLLAGACVQEAPNRETATTTGVKYGMVIDLERCLGCRSCMEACKVENNTSVGVFWMYVFRFEEGTYPNVRNSYMPRPCMHCNNAPCVKVCPVGARYSREDGVVATDWERCIGCRYCQVACPYSVNYFNWKDPKKNQYLDWEAPIAQAVTQVTNGTSPPWKNPELDRAYGHEERHIAGDSHLKGVMGKCTFCVHRIEKGLLPACVANCPGLVYTFGDLNDPNSGVSRLLQEKPSFRLAEDLGTDPSVYYLGTPPPGREARQLDIIKGRV